MTSELQEYLENEYGKFESTYLRGCHFWRVPVYALMDPPFHAIFQEFSSTFPDHPNEHNTVFYLIQSASNDCSILFHCSHFEHTFSDELPALANFVESTARIVASSQGGHIELLDGYGEKLIIRFYGAEDHIAALLRACATRVQ